MKCPECGGKTKNALHIKDGKKIAAPCKECMTKEAVRTHEVIADLALECGRRGLSRR